MLRWYTVHILCPKNTNSFVKTHSQETLKEYVDQLKSEQVDLTTFLSNCRYLSCLMSGILYFKEVETQRKIVIFDASRPYFDYHSL